MKTTEEPLKGGDTSSTSSVVSRTSESSTTTPFDENNNSKITAKEDEEEEEEGKTGERKTRVPYQDRTVLCEYPNCTRRYSNAHSRRQHYRRHHKGMPKPGRQGQLLGLPYQNHFSQQQPHQHHPYSLQHNKHPYSQHQQHTHPRAQIHHPPQQYNINVPEYNSFNNDNKNGNPSYSHHNNAYAVNKNSNYSEENPPVPVPVSVPVPASTTTKQVRASTTTKPVPGFQSDLVKAVKLGDLDKVKAILDDKSTDANAVDSRGWTALHWAAATDNDELVHVLLQRGADPFLESSSGKTSLDLATLKKTGFKTVNALQQAMQQNLENQPKHRSRSSSEEESQRHYSQYSQPPPQQQSVYINQSQQHTYYNSAYSYGYQPPSQPQYAQ
eukprot:Pgem_evm1s1533